MNSVPEMKPGPAASPNGFSAKRSLHHVNFFCTALAASYVCRVEEFNRWYMVAIPMLRTPDGRWMASLEPPHGHHRYLLVADGKPKLDLNVTGLVRNECHERVSLVAVS